MPCYSERSLGAGGVEEDQRGGGRAKEEVAAREAGGTRGGKRGGLSEVCHLGLLTIEAIHS